MSSSRPAASASAVRCRSSGDGVGSPDGWLWTRMTPAALSRTASRNSSPTRTSDDAHVALVDRRHAQDVVLRVEQDDPQLLALEAAHLEDQPVGDVARTADRPAARRPVREEPPPELERGDQLGGPGLADPGQPGELEVRSPGPARSARRAGRGRPRRGRPPIGRACRTPRRAPMQLGRGQTAGAAQGEPLARPLGDRAARGSRGPARRGRGDVVAPRHLHATLDAAAVEASPGPDDGSPPIPPAIRTSRTTQSLPSGPHRRLNRRFAARLTAAARRPARAGGQRRADVASSATTSRIAVERRVQADRRPERPAPDEQPAERERDREPRREPDERQPERLARRSRRRRSGRGRPRRAARARTTPRAGPRPRTQAVVANPRNRSSSPNGATMAPAMSCSDEAGASRRSAAAGSSGVTGKTPARGSPTIGDRHDDDRDRPRAPRRPSRATRRAGRAGGTPISRHDERAGVDDEQADQPDVDERLDERPTRSWRRAARRAATPSQASGSADQDDRARIETGTTAAKTRNGDGPEVRQHAARRAARCPATRPPATSPIDSSDERRRRSTIGASADRRPSAPMTTMPSPRSDASQPTTNSAGAARPSMVKVDVPGPGRRRSRRLGRRRGRLGVRGHGGGVARRSGPVRAARRRGPSAVNARGAGPARRPSRPLPLGPRPRVRRRRCGAGPARGPARATRPVASRRLVSGLDGGGRDLASLEVLAAPGAQRPVHARRGGCSSGRRGSGASGRSGR